MNTVSCITLQQSMVSYWPAGNHHSFIHKPTQFLLAFAAGEVILDPVWGCSSSYNVVGSYGIQSWNTWILNICGKDLIVLIYGLHMGHTLVCCKAQTNVGFAKDACIVHRKRIGEVYENACPLACVSFGTGPYVCDMCPHLNHWMLVCGIDSRI